MIGPLFSRVIVFTAIAGFMVAGIITAGCSADNVDVKVRPADPVESVKGADGLDPLTRGKVRRQILNDMQENVNIWLKADTKSYDKAFTGPMLNTYEAKLERLRKEGKDKVRVHENVSIEVVQLENPEMGTVKYSFVDKSYFVYANTKKVAAPAKTGDDKSELEIKVIREDGRWKIGSMIGSDQASL